MDLRKNTAGLLYEHRFHQMTGAMIDGLTAHILAPVEELLAAKDKEIVELTAKLQAQASSAVESMCNLGEGVAK